MSGEIEALVRAAYEAQSRGDIESYLSLLSEDFVLHIPGRSRIAGDYRGKDEMRRHFSEIAELSGGTFHTSVHDVAGTGDHAIALVEGRALKNGVPYELPRVHVWHGHEGRLTELWLHPADQYIFDEYWGR